MQACAIRGALGASAASCSPGLSASRRSKVSRAKNVGLTKVLLAPFFFLSCAACLIWKGWPLRHCWRTFKRRLHYLPQTTARPVDSKSSEVTNKFSLHEMLGYLPSLSQYLTLSQ